MAGEDEWDVPHTETRRTNLGSRPELFLASLDIRIIRLACRDGAHHILLADGVAEITPQFVISM